MTKVVPENLDTVKTRRRVEEALRKTVSEEQLVNIAGELGVELALLPPPPSPLACHHCCRFSHRQDSKRPDFGPDQVRCLCELKVGCQYKMMCKGKAYGYREVFKLLREPYYGHKYVPDSWFMDTINSRGKEHTISLADQSVVSYQSGLWNQYNWIAFTDESRPAGCCCHHHCGS